MHDSSSTTLQGLVRPVRRARSRATVGGACCGLLLISSIARGQACPCAKRDLATIVKQADVIFVGKPLAATTDSAAMGAQPAVEFQTRLMFDVATVLKGSTARATAVATPTGPCGFAFVVGADYVVFGRRQGGGVVTDACQGNVSGVEAIRARAAAIREILHPNVSPPAATVAP